MFYILHYFVVPCGTRVVLSNLLNALLDSFSSRVQALGSLVRSKLQSFNSLYFVFACGNIQLTNGNAILERSVGSQIRGLHPQEIIIDDPLCAKESHSVFVFLFERSGVLN